MRIKKSFTFSLLSAFYVSLIASAVISLVQFLIFSEAFDPKKFAIYLGVIFVFSLLIFQFRIQKYIFNNLKKIYDTVDDIESPDLTEAILNSDIEQLSKEVKKFTLYNNRQITQLNRRENYRREFLGNISHELKTPLFTVQGYLLTLIDGAKKNPKILDKYLNSANKGVDRLIAIVKDLDLITKLETANTNIVKKPFDIVELVEDVFDMLEMKAKNRQIQLGFDKLYNFPIVVLADKERMEQVVTNLVVNSIKYGKIGGQTTVKFKNKGRDKIVVKVQDNGEGISTPDQERIFERFYRVDKSRSRDQGGSGLGLSIVKHIIESHDEKISVKSKVGKGSTFSFTMEKAEKL